MQPDALVLNGGDPGEGKAAPRLRKALNRPEASPESSRETERTQAWDRNSIPRICPTPRISCDATKSDPSDPAVRLESISAEAP
jgi:hypothetical protein